MRPRGLYSGWRHELVFTRGRESENIHVRIFLYYYYFSHLRCLVDGDDNDDDDDDSGHEWVLYALDLHSLRASIVGMQTLGLYTI